ncbi:MAG TPA: hypothetical protein VFZ32_01805 [Micromonosporaceae bacterium]
MTDPVRNRAFDKSDPGGQASRQSQVLPAAYSRRIAGGQASDGPVDDWVDDMDGDWDDWQEIPVGDGWPGIVEADHNRGAVPERLAMTSLRVSVPEDAGSPASKTAEALVSERVASDQ